MKIILNKTVSIICLCEGNDDLDYNYSNELGTVLSDTRQLSCLKYNARKIILWDKTYNIIKVSDLHKIRSKVDGCYRFIYIQINLDTNDYYVGSISRRKWMGSEEAYGVYLQGIHPNPDFRGHCIRYYLLPCESVTQAEQDKKKILSANIISDAKCLNGIPGIDKIMLNSKYWTVKSSII